MTTSAAAKQLGIHLRTAYRWVSQYNACPDSIFESCKKVGRKCILTEEHKTAVINFIDANPSATVVEVTEHLLKRFHDLKVSRSTVNNFMRRECNLSLKKADFHSIERSSPAKIEERYNWVCKWENTDMNFLMNCVFLDESAFDINMKRSRAWSKKGTRAIVTRPTTRANTMSILGAISAAGLITVGVKKPSPAKKRKAEGYVSTGTVTGHYISFLKMTLDEMDKYPHMKGHCIVMDNAPIHAYEKIKKYIEYRGYKCVYLPTYSPELNPIEQFWSVAKSEVKRHRFLQEDSIKENRGSLRQR
jgi:transposase